MASELEVLGFYGLFVVAVMIAQVLAAVGQVGLSTLASSRDAMPELVGVAGRLNRALNNSIVAMALFAPAILILEVAGKTTAATLLAAQVFLAALVGYVLIYSLGAPWLRTLIWSVGALATIYLYIVGLSPSV